MNTIEDIYKHFCETPGDINEHLPVLREYAEKCEHVTEMGARWGCSTFAILSGRPKKFVSYDLNTNQNIELAKKLSNNENINFDFIKNNVLDVEIDETDLLFIDTWHKYGQLKEELRLHASKVKKYLIFHDTESYEFIDEPEWGGLYNDIKPLSKEKEGIWPAIEEFLLHNSDWLIEKRLKNNNGLTVLVRKNTSDMVNILLENNINGFNNHSGTDKHTTHSYIESYESLFEKYKNKQNNILEIGIHYGGSVLLWQEYFKNSTLDFIDIVNNIHPEITKKITDRCNLHFLDAYSDNNINIITNNKKYDIMIDDGPHTLESQMLFITKYSPYLNDGGIMVIEDIQDISYIDQLINLIPKDYSYRTLDLRGNKGRYDDILFVIEK
jgi:cephalosporin hydroxylase